VASGGTGIWWNVICERADATHSPSILVPGGHLAALSHPDELADAIERVLAPGRASAAV
jgi:hypothetical protein